MSQDDRQTGRAQGGEPPRLLGDRYDLIEVIGAGASATTWRAHDRRLDRAVAIKILRRDGDQDPNYAQRFEREARISASISDANVVQVFDVGQQDGWLYLVMQFVDGEDLKHLITRQGALPATRARDIALQMLDGLNAIHRSGILHRDIKPQNVLIDRNGKVRVTDFGIAQTTVDPGLTAVGMAVGTAAYMAPEQAEAKPLGESTDIYAAGVVLYEMLTGRLPFERPTATATMLAHMQESPTPPSVVAPNAGIPPMLDAVVMQALAKSPTNRFRSATAMARALGGDLGNPDATTRIARPSGPDATRIAPKVRPQPASKSAPPPRTPVPPPPIPSGSGGSRGALNFVLIIILLATVVVLAYVASQLLGDQNGSPNQHDPTATIAVTEEAPATERPAPTEDSGTIIEPADPTTEAPPTPTPTLEPVEPTPTQEPDPVETPPIEPEPTEEVPMIEPANGSGVPHQ